MREGRVYLVGAGPGDPELLTLKALRILRRADVVLYDRLVAKEILELIPEGAEKVYVGKRPGKHSVPQDRISEILADEAQKGRIVVRLKGGDPFLFGRGGEEAQELHRRGIPFEVVPGVSSALAVPLYAGIPLTHRRHSSSVAIVTGHEDPGKPESRVKWERLATSVDTIVVLMGMERLRAILERLAEGGRSPDTEVAVIEWGTTRRQRTTVGTLRDIAEKADERGVRPPAIVVVGDVVGLQRELSWFQK